MPFVRTVDGPVHLQSFCGRLSLDFGILSTMEITSLSRRLRCNFPIRDIVRTIAPRNKSLQHSHRHSRHPEKRLKRRRGNDSDSLRTRGRHHQQSYSSASGQAGKSENHHYKGTKRDDNQPRRHAVNSGLPKLLRTGSQIGPSLLTIILEFYSLISLGQSSSGQKKNSHMGQTGSHLVEQTFSGLQRYCLLRDVNTRHDQGAYGCMPHGSRRLFSTRQRARESKKRM